MLRFVRDYLDSFVGPPPDSLREIIEWYKQRPDELHLPERLAHLQGQPLTFREACSLLNLSTDAVERLNDARYITTDLKLKKVDTTTDPARGVKGKSKYLTLYKFSDLENWVLKKLQGTFPIIDSETGLKFSDALFCLPYGITGSSSMKCWNIPFWTSYNVIQNGFSSIEFDSRNNHSIFHYNNLLNPLTGKPWHLTTHQFRHLLNTIAQGKYLSQSLIAFWSGRASIAQNSFYDHVGQEVFIEAWHLLEEQSGVDLKVTGSLDEKAAARAHNSAISYREALALEIGSIHVTRFGLCRHNFALTPCPKDKDCLNCGENIFVAHDARMIEEAEFQIEIHANAVSECQKAFLDDEPGVERWLRLHESKLERWEMALDLLTDENTDPGTIFTLPPPAIDQTKAGLTMDLAAQKNKSLQEGKNSRSSNTLVPDLFDDL